VNRNKISVLFILIIISFIISYLPVEFVSANSETRKEKAIREANEALDKIPFLFPIDLSDKPHIEYTRHLVDAAINRHKALRNEFLNLWWLENAERAIAELELALPPTQPPKEKEPPASAKENNNSNKWQSILAATAAIADLPDISTIQIEDISAIENARALVIEALAEQGANESDIFNLSVLIEAEEKIASIDNQMAALEDTKIWAIDSSITAIEELPSLVLISLDDKFLVEDARLLVDLAINKFGASEIDIIGIEKLVAAEARLEELEQTPEKNDWSSCISGILIVVAFIIAYFYITMPKKIKIKRPQVIYIALAFLLISISIGSSYLYLQFSDSSPKPVPITSNNLIGTWKHGDFGENIYFQFLPNGVINVAVAPEGFWFSTKYRITEEKSIYFLEIYHKFIQRWERNAEILLLDNGTLIVTDIHTNSKLIYHETSSSYFMDITDQLNQLK
jgi:hypothetical protein